MTRGKNMVTCNHIYTSINMYVCMHECMLTVNDAHDDNNVGWWADDELSISLVPLVMVDG